MRGKFVLALAAMLITTSLAQAQLFRNRRMMNCENGNCVMMSSSQGSQGSQGGYGSAGGTWVRTGLFGRRMMFVPNANQAVSSSSATQTKNTATVSRDGMTCNCTCTCPNCGTTFQCQCPCTGLNGAVCKCCDKCTGQPGCTCGCPNCMCNANAAKTAAPPKEPG